MPLLRYLFLFIFFLATVGTGVFAQPVPIKVQLKWYNQFQFAGYYAAQKQGFYKKEGLDVTLRQGTPRHTPVDAVTAGEADFGVTGPDILVAFLQKKPVVVTSVIFQHSADVFVSLASRDIRTPSDLVGKTVMTSNDHGWNILRAMFMMEGIPLKSVSFVQHSWKNEDLIAGKVDAITAYSTVEPQQIRALGYGVNVIRPVDYGIDFYGDLIFTTQKKIKENPAQVEAFNRASIRGWEYAMSHPDEMADYILTLPNVKSRGINRAFLMEEFREMQKLILPNLIEIGHMNPGRWQTMLNLYKELGLAKRDANLKSFLHEPRQDRDNLFIMLVYFFAIATFISLGALLWNWQLRRQVNAKTAALRSEFEQRAAAEARLELAVQAAGLGIWEWNTTTGEISANEQWPAVFGYDYGEGPQTITEWANFVHPDDAERVGKSSDDLINQGVGANNATYRFRTKENKWKWILSFRKVVNRDADGKATHITGVHLDIDNLKNKETELNEISKELLKKNNELEKFAYITSHNLRAPVVNLKSLTDIYAEGDLDEQVADDIFLKIRQSVTRLESTLNDLIEIVSNKGDEVVKREPLHLETELKQVLLSIENQVVESGAVIEYDFSEAEHVFFSRRYLHSTMLNLITNALKYRSADRQLKIRFKSYPHKDFITFKIIDNGIGINLEKYRSKIFGLYQRFNHEREGKGLGLYIIKSQIEALDGKIMVESVPNEGTTFKVMFYNMLEA